MEGPTYSSIKDSTESVLIEYNPTEITYEDILIEMMRQHSPTRPAFKRQYRSVIFYKNIGEKGIAQNVVDSLSASKLGKKMYTDIEPITAFYRAEEYHQDFQLKRSRQLF